MKIRFKHVCHSIDTTAIVQLENHLSATVPSDYRQWIVDNNGEIPQNEYWYLCPPDRKLKLVKFIPLLGREDSGVLQYLFDLKELTGEHALLPFAMDNEFRLLAISLRKRDYGSVVRLEDYPAERSDVVLSEQFLAASLATFWQLVEERIPVTDPIIDYVRKHRSLTPLTEAGEDLLRKSMHGHTLGAEAAKHGNVSILEEWISMKLPLTNCLHLAVLNKKLECVRNLLAAGVDLQERDEYGLKPIDHCRSAEIRDLLLKAMG